MSSDRRYQFHETENDNPNINVATSSSTMDGAGANSEAVALLQALRTNPNNLIRPNNGNSNTSSTGSSSRQSNLRNKSSSTAPRPPQPISFRNDTVSGHHLSFQPPPSTVTIDVHSPSSSSSTTTSVRFGPSHSPPPPLTVVPTTTTTVAEEFANQFTTRLQGFTGERRRTWIAWVAVIALIVTIGLAAFVSILHFSHKELSARVDVHSKSLQDFSVLKNASETVALLNSIPSIVSDFQKRTLADPPSSPKSSSQQHHRPPPINAKRFPHEDDKDQRIASGHDDDSEQTTNHVEQQWRLKTLLIPKITSNDAITNTVIKDWEDIPFDRLLAYVLCCRTAIGTANEEFRCAPEIGGSGVMRTEKNGTRLRLSASDMSCTFRYLS